MAAVDLLARNPNPSEDEIRHGLEGNLCRCTGYHNIVRAVADAAKHPHAGGSRAGGDAGWRASRARVRDPRGRGMSVADEPRAGGDGGLFVGRAMKRKEDPRLITGRATYVDDITLVGQLWMAFVRSPEAHARIVSIDAAAAEARDDVVAVFTGEDLGDLESPLPMAWVPPASRCARPSTGRWRAARSSTWAIRSPSSSARTATPSWTPPRRSSSSTSPCRS